jgi:hypothetical protein
MINQWNGVCPLAEAILACDLCKRSWDYTFDYTYAVVLCKRSWDYTFDYTYAVVFTGIFRFLLFLEVLVSLAFDYICVITAFGRKCMACKRSWVRIPLAPLTYPLAC